MPANPLSRYLSPLIQPLYGGMGSILMFHRVCPPSGKKPVPGASDIEYSPEQFERTLNHLLKREYQFISLDDLYEGLQEKSLHQKFAVITFDDGYADNYTIAYPILKQKQIPFAVYVTTSFPDQNAILWWYLLEDLLDREEEICIRNDEAEERFDLRKPDQRTQASLTIRRIMKSSNPQDFARNVENIFTENGLDPLSKVKTLAMSWDQLARLNADPLATIGAHTVNHYLLSRLTEEQAKQEISTARENLAARLHHPIEHFAYPFGGISAAGEREFRLVKEMGFKTAVTTRPTRRLPGTVIISFQPPSN